MSYLKNKKLSLLILLSLTLVSIVGGQVTPPQNLINLACPTPSTSYTIVKAGSVLSADSSSGGSARATNYCMLNTDLVLDCSFYDTTTGKCYCDDNNKNQAIIISGTQYACVPANQIVINAQTYTRLGANSYSANCYASYPFIVSLDATASNNPNNYLRACTNLVVPNCNAYRVVASSFDISLGVSSSPNAFSITCSKCLAGYDAFSTAQTTGFSLSSSNYVAGIGCPRNGATDTVCTKITLDTNSNYQCDCTGLTSTTQSVSFYSSNYNGITMGCLDSSKLPYDTNCLTYLWNTDPTQYTCAQCKTGYRLITLKGTATGNVWIACLPESSRIAGCKDNSYAVNAAGAQVSLSPSPLYCSSCKDNYQLSTSNSNNITITINGSISTSTVSKVCDYQSVNPSNCNTAVNINEVTTCISCQPGYTVLYGSCVASVPFCASLSSSGVCSSCVQGYQLINNKCIEIPSNCAQTNPSSGACTVCKTGFTLDSTGKCAVSNVNYCPAGQVPYYGYCIQVQIPIADCSKYTVDIRCD